MASSESGDDSIYNMSRLTTEKNISFFQFLKHFFLLVFFTSRKQIQKNSHWDSHKENVLTFQIKDISLAVKKPP